MKIFPPPIEIGANEGFLADKDIFGRKEFGDGLTNLMAAASDPLVVMLDSPWGTGKTIFIKMWAGQLRQAGFPVIVFDAFENDHVENGFLAIASEVVAYSNSINNSKTKSHKSFLKKASRAGSILLRTGAKIGIKAATLGAIDATDIEGLKSVGDDIAKETSTNAEKYVEAILGLHSKEKETLAALRQALSELVESFQKNNSGEDPSTRPLVFIIDELDRCKPDFALELLEKIKHIFSTTQVHFVLAVHLTQLENSVRFSYGPEVDAKTYLQKFYNVIAHFPERGRGKHERVTPKYINYLRNSMDLSGDDLDVLENVAEARGFSLRTIERIVTCIAIAKQFTPRNYLWLDPIIIGLCIMKVADTHIFHRARAGKLTLKEADTCLAFDSWSDDTSGSEWARHWWIYCLASKEEDHPDINWQSHKEALFRYALHDRKAILRIMAGHVDRFQLPR